jgi:hypothetical protein
VKEVGKFIGRFVGSAMKGFCVALFVLGWCGKGDASTASSKMVEHMCCFVPVEVRAASAFHDKFVKTDFRQALRITVDMRT